MRKNFREFILTHREDLSKYIKYLEYVETHINPRKPEKKLKASFFGPATNFKNHLAAIGLIDSTPFDRKIVFSTPSRFLKLVSFSIIYGDDELFSSLAPYIGSINVKIAHVFSLVHLSMRGSDFILKKMLEMNPDLKWINPLFFYNLEESDEKTKNRRSILDDAIGFSRNRTYELIKIDSEEKINLKTELSRRNLAYNTEKMLEALKIDFKGSDAKLGKNSTEKKTQATELTDEKIKINVFKDESIENDAEPTKTDHKTKGSLKENSEPWEKSKKEKEFVYVMLSKDSKDSNLHENGNSIEPVTLWKGKISSLKKKGDGTREVKSNTFDSTESIFETLSPFFPIHYKTYACLLKLKGIKDVDFNKNFFVYPLDVFCMNSDITFVNLLENKAPGCFKYGEIGFYVTCMPSIGVKLNYYKQEIPKNILKWYCRTGNYGMIALFGEIRNIKVDFGKDFGVIAAIYDNFKTLNVMFSKGYVDNEEEEKISAILRKKFNVNNVIVDRQIPDMFLKSSKDNMCGFISQEECLEEIGKILKNLKWMTVKEWNETEDKKSIKKTPVKKVFDLKKKYLDVLWTDDFGLC